MKLDTSIYIVMLAAAIAGCGSNPTVQLSALAKTYYVFGDTPEHGCALKYTLTQANNYSSAKFRANQASTQIPADRKYTEPPKVIECSPEIVNRIAQAEKKPNQVGILPTPVPDQDAPRVDAPEL